MRMTKPIGRAAGVLLLLAVAIPVAAAEPAISAAEAEEMLANARKYKTDVADRSSDTARRLFSEVIHRHPGTPQAAAAMDALESMGETIPGRLFSPGFPPEALEVPKLHEFPDLADLSLPRPEPAEHGESLDPLSIPGVPDRLEVPNPGTTPVPGVRGRYRNDPRWFAVVAQPTIGWESVS